MVGTLKDNRDSAEGDHFPPECQGRLDTKDRVRSGWDLDKENKYGDGGREGNLVRDPSCE